MADAAQRSTASNDVETQLVRVVEELEAARRRLVTIADDPHERNTLEEQILRLEDDLGALERTRAQGSGSSATTKNSLGTLEGSDLLAFLQSQSNEVYFAHRGTCNGFCRVACCAAILANFCCIGVGYMLATG
eukprot:m.1068488 g.1068488  ORF g.1068488 m.1068488 type:complete len:133 (-) comp24225_c0_seq15:4282-4680(-)